MPIQVSLKNRDRTDSRRCCQTSWRAAPLSSPAISEPFLPPNDETGGDEKGLASLSDLQAQLPELTLREMICTAECYLQMVAAMFVIGAHAHVRAHVCKLVLSDLAQA